MEDTYIVVLKDPTKNPIAEYCPAVRVAERWHQVDIAGQWRDPGYTFKVNSESKPKYLKDLIRLGLVVKTDSEETMSWVVTNKSRFNVAFEGKYLKPNESIHLAELTEPVMRLINAGKLVCSSSKELSCEYFFETAPFTVEFVPILDLKELNHDQLTAFLTDYGIEFDPTMSIEQLRELALSHLEKAA